jgi:integrase
MALWLLQKSGRECGILVEKQPLIPDEQKRWTFVWTFGVQSESRLRFCTAQWQAFCSRQMYHYLSTAAHALTGQRVTPHLVRDIFATHFLDKGAPDSDVASLAYAMGHSQEMLRASYDRRTPNQKHRPIQLAVMELVQKSLHPDSTSD